MMRLPLCTSWHLPALQAIRDSEWEISEIIRTRTNQEQNITLETPYYDIVRIKVGPSVRVCGHAPG